MLEIPSAVCPLKLCFSVLVTKTMYVIVIRSCVDVVFFITVIVSCSVMASTLPCNSVFDLSVSGLYIVVLGEA